MLTEKQLDQFLDEFWEDSQSAQTEAEQEISEENLEEYALPADGMIIPADGPERQGKQKNLVCTCTDASGRTASSVSFSEIFSWKKVSHMQPDRDHSGNDTVLYDV